MPGQGQDSGLCHNCGYESIETDWRKLVRAQGYRRRRYLVPNNLHKESPSPVLRPQDDPVRKAAGDEHREGEEMCAAVEKGRVANTVWTTTLPHPSRTMAKELIDQGRLGQDLPLPANFLQDWTINADLPQGGNALWRLDAAAAGSGVTGDLLAHQPSIRRSG